MRFASSVPSIVRVSATEFFGWQPVCGYAGKKGVDVTTLGVANNTSR